MTAVDIAQALYLLLAALGLSLSVSWAGLPVLGGSAFLAVGAYGTALLGPGGQGWPLGGAVLASTALGAAVGYLTAAAAAQLEGAPLALASWTLVWLVQSVLLAYPGHLGGTEGLVRPSPAHLVSRTLGVDLVIGPWVHVGIALGLCGLVAAALVRVARGPGGLDLAALREGPLLAASLGVPVAHRRRTVLALSAALLALAGAGKLLLLGLVVPSDVSPLVSLQLFVAVLVGGTARWWGPVVGVALLTALPHVADQVARATGADPEQSRGALTAALLVLVLALRGPLSARFGRLGPAPTGPVQSVAAGTKSEAEPALVAQGLTVSFGSVDALKDVEIALAAGEVHALIGPNGSGKTTLLRVLAGEIRTGSVVLDGRLLPHRGVAARVRDGIVRTTQQTLLMARLPADQQVAVGARGGRSEPQAVVRHLLATPASRRSDQQLVVDGALDALGLRHVVGAGAQRLTTGDQRLLQVARAYATGARVLLLDEPAAGMSVDERRRLVASLRRLADEGAAVLLVEHDLRLVEQVADRVTVLDQGRVLLTGTPSQVRADPSVRKAYLG